MSKELEQTSAIQSKLFKPFFGQEGLRSRIDQARRNQLPLGKTLPELDGRNSWEKILGPFAVKVGLVTDPENPKTLIPEQLAAFGGWCAIRTKDVDNLDDYGTIANPETGFTEPVQSAAQVARFIEGGVTFDQVVESIGAVNASTMIAISEEALWGTRIVDKVRNNIRLDGKDEDLIREAIANVEQQKFMMTGRYLELVRGTNSLQIVRDTDILPVLTDTRNKLLQDIGTNVKGLAQAFKKPQAFVDGQTLVFTMYTEDYCNALKKGGFTKADKFLIAEPLLHTYASSEALNYLVFKIFGERGDGVYFDPKGTNPNTGFAAFVECLTGDATSVRRVMNMGAVPNVSNWEIMCSKERDSNSLSGILTAERNRVLDPTRNLLFLWALNFIPFGETLNTLLAVIDKAEEFKTEKARLNKTFSSGKMGFKDYSSIQQMVQDLRQDCLKDLDVLNQKLACDLESFFRYLTTEVRL